MSSGNLTTIQVPVGLVNPTTTLAWLPEAVGTQFELTRYIFVGTLSAWLWDWFSAFPDEYRVIFQQRRSSVTAVYIISRLGTLGYLLSVVLFQTTPVSNCDALMTAIGSSLVGSIPFSGLLFFFRLRALFLKENLVVGFFAISWLSVFVTSIMSPFSTKAARIGPTNYCIDGSFKPYVAAAPIANAVNGTLVFIAITWRLLSLGADTSGRGRIQTFINGRSTSRVVSALLRDGQMYYFATVGFNVVTCVLLMSPSVPSVVGVFCGPASVAMENAMTTRVFRHLRLAKMTTSNLVTTAGAATHSVRIARRDPDTGLYSMSFARPPGEQSTKQEVGRMEDEGETSRDIDTESTKIVNDV